MRQTKIVIENEAGVKLAYSSLKTCCKFNPDWSYGYLHQQKLPKKYKGWIITRVPYNEGPGI